MATSLATVEDDPHRHGWAAVEAGHHLLDLVDDHGVPRRMTEPGTAAGGDKVRRAQQTIARNIAQTERAESDLLRTLIGVVIHMARRGTKGTFCGRSTSTVKWLDPYRTAPDSDDRWCKRCWETTVHVAVPTGDDQHRDDTVVMFGRSPYSAALPSLMPRKSLSGAKAAAPARPFPQPPAGPSVRAPSQSPSIAPANKKGQRRWTEAEILALRSPKGGFTRAALAQMGVPWPPPSNWKRSLMNGVRIGFTEIQPSSRPVDEGQPTASPLPTVAQKASAPQEDQRVWIDGEGYLRHGNRRGVV
jgi:hypothetical protein